MFLFTLTGPAHSSAHQQRPQGEEESNYKVHDALGAMVQHSRGPTASTLCHSQTQTTVRGESDWAPAQAREATLAKGPDGRDSPGTYGDSAPVLVDVSGGDSQEEEEELSEKVSS